jgi:hypothetical protein
LLGDRDNATERTLHENDVGWGHKRMELGPEEER